MKWAAAAMFMVTMLLGASVPHAPAGKFGGTFIGAMIAQDGIVVASDSRSTFLDKAGKHIGYVDRMTKIYVDHGAAVAVSGLTSVEDELFSSFMGRNDYLLRRPVNEILHDVALRLPFRNTTNVLLISGGFLDGRATICARAPADPQACNTSGYITNKVSPGLRRWFEARGGRIPAHDEAAAALKQAIREAADVDSGVGGPTAILLLPKAGMPRWLENPPDDNGWTRVCDIVGSYRKGSVPIFFTNSKEELDRYLGAVCPR